MSKNKHGRRSGARSVREDLAPPTTVAIAPADARKLMERAVEVMQHSVAEPRPDGKASPRVGAILQMRDGSVIEAQRGELRHGDHAEYTLIERKCRDRKLDGARLFATLEPCAPGARNHPKMACAERIALARVQEVWVGITDPDPTVDGQGIRYLAEHGVQLHMFDRDLQEKIRAANRDFLKNALRRAAMQPRSTRSTTPGATSMEQPIGLPDLAALHSPTLDRYVRRVGLDLGLRHRDAMAMLKRQRLITGRAGREVPTGFGLLLFGARPREVLPQAGVIATVRYLDGREASESFEGPLLNLPGDVVAWLKRMVPTTIDRSTVGRSRRAGLPIELIRESLVNALLHRDYDVKGAKIQVVVTPGSVLLRSPGEPIPPITLADLQTFSAPTLSRNPRLHYVFRQMGLAEEAGLGMSTLRSAQEKYGLPTPRYSYKAPYLDLTIYLTAEGAAQGRAGKRLEQLKPDERRGWEFVIERSSVAPREYAGELGVDVRTALRHLSRFVELGLLRRAGAGRSTRYEVQP